MKFAFSTIACPEWTLEDVCELASRCGYRGVELRTFGHASTELACDPCLTGAAKVRDLFEDAGVIPMCLGTSIRFDKPVWPPIIGHAITDTEKCVRETKAMVEVAAQREIPGVRVFGFEFHENEKRHAGVKRIVERLQLACATARNTGVKIYIENAGSFATGAQLREIIDRVANPLLVAAYSPAVGEHAGESPSEAFRALDGVLGSVKITDMHNGRPAPLGAGDIGAEAVVRELAERAYDGWLVYEWPRLWFGHLGDANEVLPDAAEKLYRWAAGARVRSGSFAGSR